MARGPYRADARTGPSAGSVPARRHDDRATKLPRRGLREVARARQRLHDPRAGALPFELTPAPDPADLRAAHRRLHATGSCCWQRHRGRGARRAHADLQPGRVGVGAVGQRRPRGDPVSAPARAGRMPSAFSLLTAAGEIRARDRVADRRARSTWAPRRCRARTIPAGAPHGRRRAERGRRAAGAFSTSPSATRSARSRSDRRARARRRSTSAAIGPDDRAPRAVPEPHQRVLVHGARAGRIRARIFERGVGETSASGTGATGAAVAHVLAGRPLAGHASLLDGGELEVEVGEELSISLSGWARARVRGHARPRVREGAACDRVGAWTRSRRTCSPSSSARSPPSAPPGST